MNKIPIYEVINQQFVAVDKLMVDGLSVFRPLIGDECTVTLINVKRSCIDCNCCDITLSAWMCNTETVGTNQVHHILVIGEADCTVDRGLEAVVSNMKSGELWEFCLRCSNNRHQEIGGCHVTGQVKLLRIKKCAGGMGWRGDDKLKLIEAVRHKDVGNQLYGQGRYVDSFHRFNRSMRAILFLRNVDSVREARDVLYTTVCNNMAACQLELGNYEYALQLSGKALALDSDNLKALVRHCRASVELGMFDNALNDARHALDLDPSNTVAKHYLAIATRGVDSQNARYIDIIKKMFAS